MLGGLFVYLKPVISPPSTAPVVFELVVRNQALVLGPSTITVVEGSNVVIKITSDVAQSFHLHGYDILVDLQPNVQAQISFTANLTGQFEFELEQSSTRLGVLQVIPR